MSDDALNLDNLFEGSDSLDDSLSSGDGIDPLFSDSEMDSLFRESSQLSDGTGDLSSFFSEAPVVEEPPQETAQQVEDTFLALIEKGQAHKILELTDPSVPSVIDRDARAQFSPLYHRAMAECPAIGIYPRLVKAGFPLTLSEEGCLCIQFPSNVEILKFTDSVGNFLASADRRVCEVTDTLLSYRDAALESSKQNGLQAILPKTKTHGEKSLDASSLDFTEYQMKDADLTIDPSGGAFGQEVVVETRNLGISLSDYSNKAVAEWLTENADSLDEEAVKDTLKEEGFSTQRISEIVGIIKYLKVNAGLDRRQSTLNNRDCEPENKPLGISF